MATLPPNYLSKQQGRHIPITTMDAVVLLHNMLVAAEDPSIGFEDANRTIADVSRILNRRKLYIEPSLLESLLWSSNLLDEKKEFFHFNKLTFDEFITKLGIKFNKFYNLIERKD